MVEVRTDIEWSTKKTDLIDYINKNEISLSIQSDCSEVRDLGEKGWGRIATKNIKKDKIITRIGGFWVTRKEREKYLDKDYFLFVEGEFYFQGGLNPKLNGSHNHSCDPNAYVEDYMIIRALRNIKKDEEITVDYGSFIDHSGVILKNCKCGAKGCRKRITGKDWQKHNLVIKYQFKCCNNIINRFLTDNYEISFRKLPPKSLKKST